MMYNEREMINICKKYGIELVEKEGNPIYMGKEMDDDFSFSEMMKKTVQSDDSIYAVVETIELSLPVYVDNSLSYNCCVGMLNSYLTYKSVMDVKNVESSISYDNKNKYAA